VCVCVYLFGLVNEQCTRNPLRMFENRFLRRIFWPKRDDVTGEWRKLHNEELNDLHSSRNIVRMIKSRMRWAGYIACMGRGEVHRGFWWKNVRERNHLGDPSEDGRITLRWIFRKWEMGYGLNQAG